MPILSKIESAKIPIALKVADCQQDAAAHEEGSPKIFRYYVADVSKVPNVEMSSSPQGYYFESCYLGANIKCRSR